MTLAAHAARPTCPACGRLVRGGVELQADVAQLREALAAAHATRGGEGGPAYELLLRVADAEVAAISAELTGMHLQCATARRPEAVH